MEEQEAVGAALTSQEWPILVRTQMRSTASVYLLLALLQVGSGCATEAVNDRVRGGWRQDDMRTPKSAHLDEDHHLLICVDGRLALHPSVSFWVRVPIRAISRSPNESKRKGYRRREGDDPIWDMASRNVGRPYLNRCNTRKDANPIPVPIRQLDAFSEKGREVANEVALAEIAKDFESLDLDRAVYKVELRTRDSDRPAVGRIGYADRGLRFDSGHVMLIGLQPVGSDGSPMWKVLLPPAYVYDVLTFPFLVGIMLLVVGGL